MHRDFFFLVDLQWAMKKKKRIHSAGKKQEKKIGVCLGRQHTPVGLFLPTILLTILVCSAAGLPTGILQCQISKIWRFRKRFGIEIFRNLLTV